MTITDLGPGNGVQNGRRLNSTKCSNNSDVKDDEWTSSPVSPAGVTYSTTRVAKLWMG